MLLEKLITEILAQVISEAEAPKTAPFGQYLFAPDRNDLSPEEQEEENTDLEDELFYAFQEHYTGNSIHLEELAKILLMAKQKGWYSKILSPKDETVYRVLVDLSVEKAAAVIGSSPQFLLGNASGKKKNEIVNSNLVLSSYGSGELRTGETEDTYDIQSWTAKPNINWFIKDLGIGNLYPRECVIIIVAKTNNNDNFFINSSGVKNIDELPSYAYYQDETISYGTVKYEKAFVIANKSTYKITEDTNEYLELLFKYAGIK